MRVQVTQQEGKGREFVDDFTTIFPDQGTILHHAGSAPKPVKIMGRVLKFRNTEPFPKGGGGHAIRIQFPEDVMALKDGKETLQIADQQEEQGTEQGKVGNLRLAFSDWRLAISSWRLAVGGGAVPVG